MYRACVAIPLERFFQTVFIVLGFAIAYLILGPLIMLILIFAHSWRIFGQVLLGLYGILIFLPEKIHQFIRNTFLLEDRSAPGEST